MCVGPAGAVTRARRDAALSGSKCPSAIRTLKRASGVPTRCNCEGFMLVWQPTQLEDLRARSGQMTCWKRCEKAATSSGAYRADGATGCGADLSGGPAQLRGPTPHRMKRRIVSPAPTIRNVFAPFVVPRRIVQYSVMRGSALLVSVVYVV